MPETPNQAIEETAHPDISRNIPKDVRDHLCIKAAGRCQLCNRFLFEHPTTLRAGNFSEAAHIVAFSPNGPRGNAAARPEDINGIENLMLLCHDCHRQIDAVEPDAHSEASLAQKKRDQEAHVREMMDILNPERTAVVRFIAPTRGRNPSISFETTRLAVSPRFPIQNPGTIIDMTGVSGNGRAFVDLAKATIDREMVRLYSPGAEAQRANHVSVFGIAPIPLLAYLGHRISDMFPVQLFPHDPNTNAWTWRDERRPAIVYTTQRVRTGTDVTKVALVLSLSGTIELASLPTAINAAFTILEMTMVDRQSEPGFLRQANDLEAFRSSYRGALASIKTEHGDATEVHLFAAVPPPIAIACGLDRRREIMPHLVLYQNTEAGFIPMLTIDDHDA